MQFDHNKGSYNFELWNCMQGAVDSYEQDRQAYWEDMGGFSATDYDRAERFAEAVFKSSERLLPVGDMDNDLSRLRHEIHRIPEINKKADEILRSDLPVDKKKTLIIDLLNECPPNPESDDSPLKLVWERLSINLSWEAIGKMEEGASRIFRLYNLVLSSSPSEPTQEFLGRLSRCYIWGFDPECVILCRAVIDTAFKDSVAYEICEDHFGKRYSGGFSLNDRICVAQKEGIIDEDIAKKAQTVRQRGNQAVHRQPSVTNVWGIICDTVAVLERITQKK